jgi:hypothetical protein
VTRCPTACAAPSQGSGSPADRAQLRQRNEQHETARELARERRNATMSDNRAKRLHRG